MNENEFFRNATLRICSSLDPDKALGELLHYVKDFIPIRGMDFGIVDKYQGLIHFVAWASLKGDQKPYPKIKISAEFLERAMSFFEGEDRFGIINDPSEIEPDSFKDISQVWPFCAMLTMRFDVEGQLLGGMTMWMDDKQGFTEERVRLINLLHDPCAIAFSNMVKHQETIELKQMLDDDNRNLREQLVQMPKHDVIGEHSGLKGVMEMVRQVAIMNSPVLLFGETGVGKEMIAGAIHYASKRQERPFVKVNCGAIPETLIDSELFGYEKGSFTGADTQKRGKFELANNGTIFLDEIGELSAAAQVRLLRVLQEKEIERVGGHKTIPIDVRILCATHRNMEEMIKSGKFREDLWFRLNVFPITIPPLRHRKEDISTLVSHFVKKKTAEMNIPFQPPIDTIAIERLMDYNWPGNVRELENLVERSLIKSYSKKSGEFLLFEDSDFLDTDHHNNNLFMTSEGNMLSFEQVIKMHIIQAIKRTNGKIEGKNGAAQILRLNPNTLRTKMRKLGIARKQCIRQPEI